MTLLVAGLALFIVLHLVPSIAPLRAGLVAGMGEKTYRGVFSALAFAGLAMIVWGYSAAPFEPVYAPPDWGRQAAMWVVPAALVLFAAANMPTHIRSIVRHPMLLGLLLWALAHLAANGDLRSLLLFGGLAGFSVVAAASAVARGKRPPADKPPRLAMDAAALVAGLVVAGLLAYFHAALFGVPVL
ncbi:MAG: NnrU family protein [Alphaproteobacteria bacterium]|nr:NnrU family protein [Alphaproteobacteria bacterium]